jgi:hypothetical protein
MPLPVIFVGVFTICAEGHIALAAATKPTAGAAAYITLAIPIELAMEMQLPMALWGL